MIVECRQLVKVYQEDHISVTAVNKIDLNVDEGEFLSLSGPSGSGKTTLLNLIGGLDKASQGEINLAGQRIDQMDRSKLADLRLAKIGFVFQAYNLLPVLSALENVEFIMLLQGITSQERRTRAYAILKEVGLEGLEHRRPAELSGGQQQRVAVARAIVSKPAVVLADEPTANLDSANSDDLLDLMSHMNRQFGVTFIVASHDPRVIEHTSRRIRMLDGQIVEDERVSA